MTLNISSIFSKRFFFRKKEIKKGQQKKFRILAVGVEPPSSENRKIKHPPFLETIIGEVPEIT